MSETNEIQPHVRYVAKADETPVFWDNIDFFAIFKQCNESVYEFTVFAIVGRAGEIGWDHPGCALFEEKGATNGNPTDQIEWSSPFLTGDIRWDGCVNLYFDEQDNCALHFCGRKDAGRIGLLIERIYDFAETAIPHWSGR